MADKKISRPDVVLAIDSANTPLRIALACGGRIYKASRKGIKQEEYLFPAVKSLLKKAGIGMNDVGSVMVLRGPGRFTGIRIGLTFAAVMRELNGTCVRADTVFRALAWQTGHTKAYLNWKTANPQGLVCVVLHAFRGEYFCQFIEADGAAVREAEAPRWLPKAEMLDYIKAAKVALYCVGAAEHGAPLAGLLPQGMTVAPEKDCALDAGILAAYAEFAPEAEVPVSPLYLKPARFEMTAAGK